jgi:hypothetical protein
LPIVDNSVKSKIYGSISENVIIQYWLKMLRGFKIALNIHIACFKVYTDTAAKVTC